MEINFKIATTADSTTIGSFVVDLTNEISQLTKAKHFTIDLNTTVERCKELIASGHYSAIIAEYQNKQIAMATFTETYALYAGGKIGLIQEFYVTPEYRSSGVGSMLIEHVRLYGKQHGWSCIELCTPPLPEFDQTLKFYQKNGLVPVGGRKMRQAVT